MDDKWLEVSIDTTDAGLDELSAYLTRFDTGGLVIEGEAEFQAFLEQNRQYWDYVDEDLLERMRGVARVKFYVTDDSNGHGKLAQITDGLEAFRARAKAPGTLQVRTASLCEEDWANNWKQYYKPLSVGERLYIVPEWEKESGEVPAGRTALYLNPGLIFGTGSHASTQLCLEGVEACTRPGDAVLDLGCGSGILSIAALKLGAASAAAVDIDDKCRDVAYENAALNGIGQDTYTVRIGDVLGDAVLRADLGGGWQMVVANIVADVIIGLSPLVRPMLAPGGLFLCSGIIDDRAQEVADRLRENGWEILETRSAEGWFSYLCR